MRGSSGPRAELRQCPLAAPRGHSLDRDLRCIFDLPEREIARSVGNARMGEDSAHDEAVVVGDVADGDSEEIVPLAGHGVAFDDLLAGLDEILEIGPGLDRLAGHPHLAQDVDRAAEGLRAGDPHGSAEHARLLEGPDPPPHRGRGSSDPLAEGGVAEARIPLQFANDSAVDRVETIIFFPGCPNS